MTFTIHMAWHMTLVTALAPAVVVMARGTRLDPVMKAPALFSPLLACLIEFIVVWGWHIPAMHDAARHHAGWWMVEQLSFAAAAGYLWLSALAGTASQRPGRAGWSLIALVLTFAHMTMLGVLVAVAPRALYTHTVGMLHDQQLGGAVMIAAGAISYPLAALWLSRALVVSRAATGART